MISKLKLFSLGIVAENKKLSSKVIKVTPIELIPMVDGEIKEDVQTLESKGLDSDGNEYSVSVKTDITIDAEWFSLDSNRRTPHDVRRGEQVLILQSADTDKFYWYSMGRNDNLRRLETAVWAWSDESDPTKDIELTVDNTYSLEISTHKKTVTFQTCKNDGEAFKYTLQINAAESKVTLTDDNSNYFVLDSANTKLHMHNADGTDFALDKKDITAYAPRDFNFRADRDATISIGRNLNIDVGMNTTFTVGQTYALSCTNYTLTASASITNTTASYTTMCPTNFFSGNLAVGGALVVAGGGGGGGGASASVVGDMEIAGSVTITSALTCGFITCAGIVSATPPIAPGGAWHLP